MELQKKFCLKFIIIFNSEFLFCKIAPDYSLNSFYTLSYISTENFQYFQLNKYSDVDLLVISKNVGKRLKLIDQLDSSLEGLNLARDIIVVSDNEYEKDKFIPGTFSRYAYLEGKVIYDRR